MMYQHSWGPPPTMSSQGMTLDRHILERQRAIPGATGDFTGLFQQIALAAKIINSRVRQAGLAGILGLTGEKNVQGEEVQTLDAFAQNVMERSVRRISGCLDLIHSPYDGYCESTWFFFSNSFDRGPEWPRFNKSVSKAALGDATWSILARWSKAKPAGSPLGSLPGNKEQ